MFMKKGKKQVSNKLHYTIVSLIALVLLSVGVYAFVSAPAPGAAPNPGHDLSTISPPEGCTNGQFLRFLNPGSYPGRVWDCGTPSMTVPTNYVRNVEVVTDSSSASLDSRTAYCPSGKSPLGGGCRSASGTTTVRSYPLSSGWACDFSVASKSHYAYAICANIN